MPNDYDEDELPELAEDDAFAVYMDEILNLIDRLRTNKAKMLGLSTGDIHSKLGHERSKWTLDALALISGIEEYQCGAIRRWRRRRETVTWVKRYFNRTPKTVADGIPQSVHRPKKNLRAGVNADHAGETVSTSGDVEASQNDWGFKVNTKNDRSLRPFARVTPTAKRSKRESEE